MHFIASCMKYFYVFLFLLISLFQAKTEVKIEVSKSNINFGEVAYCKKVTDTIVVKNSPTSTANLKLLVGEKITGANAQNFRITNPKIKDLDLPPFDGTNSVIYVVEFDASLQPFGEKNAILEIPNDTKDSVIKIPITGKSTMIEYELSPQLIDFKDISINQSYSQNLEITLKSKFPSKIISVDWKDKQQLLVDINGNLDLVPNAKTILPVKINLNSLGIFNDTLQIKIQEPCDTIFKIPVKANAPNGFMQGFQNIDFGVISDCESKIDSLSIIFTGYGSGQIQSIEIEGEGKENIQAYFDKPFPIQLTNGTNEIFKILLNPTNQNFGKKQVLIKVNSEINLEVKQYTFFVDYEIAEVVLYTNFAILDFANTYTNQIDVKEIEIINPTPFDIQIDKIEFVCQNNAAFFIDPQITLPLIFNKGNKQNFQIYFKPQKQNTNHNCNMEISYSSHNCSKNITISINARSLSKAILALSFSDLKNIEINPKDASLSIPISINTSENEIIINDTLYFDVSYPRSIFHFEKIISNNTVLIKNTLNSTERILSLRTIFNNSKITNQKSNLGLIEGIPLLGDVPEGLFTFNSYYFVSKSNSYEVNKVDSLPFKLIVCNQGEPRLLKFDNQNKSIIQTNYYDIYQLEIIINAIESGINKIILYDYLGNQTYYQEFITTSKNSINFYLNTQSFNKGVYLLILMTPSEIYSEKLFIE